MAQYESKAVPKMFGATSRASVKIKDSFYTFEASLTREFPAGTDMSEVDMEQEFILLYNELNNQVDAQIDDVEKTYANAENRK